MFLTNKNKLNIKMKQNFKIIFIIITDFLNRFKDLIYHYSKLSYNNFTLLNVCSIVFVLFIFKLDLIEK